MDMFSAAPQRAIEYLMSKRGNDFLDMSDGSIAISTCFDIIQSIGFLIDIMEFDLMVAFGGKLFRGIDFDNDDSKNLKNQVETSRLKRHVRKPKFRKADTTNRHMIQAQDPSIMTAPWI